MRTQVIGFIADHFEEGAVTVRPCEILPGGCVIKDKKGDEMIIYFDILKQEVKTTFPSLEEVK